MKRIWKSGEPLIWLTGGALAFNLIMVGGLLILIMSRGLGFFWPSDIATVILKDGRRYLGEIKEREAIPMPGVNEIEKNYRIQMKIGNRDLYGLDFKWVDEDDISEKKYPGDSVALERREWGNMYGFIKEIRSGDTVVAKGDRESWPLLQSLLPDAHELYREIKRIETEEIGDINYNLERLRLKIRGLELKYGKDSSVIQDEINKINARIKERQQKYRELESRLTVLYTELNRDKVIVETGDGKEKDLSIGIIVRAYKPNSMSTVKKTGFYLSKLYEFLTDNPRESNTEGGIFPAIFGTVMMVLIMTVAVMPFGVLAALYLREYAKQGPLVRMVRISVNNLAGVPSIVFGVFGLGFFIYGIGGSIDRLFFQEALPTPTFGTGGILWASLTLALLTLPVVIVSTEEGLAAVPQEIRHGSLALGANKIETLLKVVIPGAAPGILTGLILAIARATGEVAPLMITGVVKLAPTLPLDGHFPFVHLERKFMHLGFHIYDVGFQSPNVEAAKPMVYATTLLLIVIVVVLNLTAIGLRNYLRKKYASAAF